MRSVEFHPDAKREFISAAQFYESQSEGLGLDFLLTVQRTCGWRATEDSVLTLADHLPGEAAEALLELATGGTPRRVAPAVAPPDPFEHPDAMDEAQDVSVAQLRFIAALGSGRPEALFFAGDLGQRIFQLPFSWRSLGVDIRGRS